MIIEMLCGYAFTNPPAHPNVPLAIGSSWTRTSQIYCKLSYGGIADGRLQKEEYRDSIEASWKENE